MRTQRRTLLKTQGKVLKRELLIVRSRTRRLALSFSADFLQEDALPTPFPGLKEVGFYRDENKKVRKCSVEKLEKFKDAGLDTWTNTSITFMGTDINNRWGQLETYGGKLVENITQAVARDLLAHSMIVLDKEGYDIVLHVHDEIACEVPLGTKSLEEMEALMSQLPEWGAGLPMEAEGWRGRRYRK